MQGQRGQEGNERKPPDRSMTGKYSVPDRLEQYRETGKTGAYRLSELSGQQRAIPKRPSGMTYVDRPLSTPRVARPQIPNRERKPKTWRWWTGALLISAFVIVGVGMLAYGATNLFLAASVSAGSASAAGNFLSSLQDANYDQAYDYLAPTLTVQMSRSDFKQMALADDHCYGQITDYSEVDNSAVTRADGSQSFTYTMTRSKLTRPYQLQLTLQKDATGDWSITSYGNDLGPTPPTCK